MGVDFHELEQFHENLQRLSDREIDAVLETCVKELAKRLLALVIPVTPVGDYPASTGKIGGTLRRGWTARRGSGNDTKQAMYENMFGSERNMMARSIEISKEGNAYIAIVRNPVDYAFYVEFGHRTAKGGWVEGRFFLTESEEKLKRLAPRVLERIITKKITEVLDSGI